MTQIKPTSVPHLRAIGKMLEVRRQ